MVSVRKNLLRKRIICRVDSSINIGVGHVMRCLTLADELTKQGAEISFITRVQSGSMEDAIKKKGHEVFLLPATTDTYQVKDDDVVHASWLRVPWVRDAEEAEAAIGTSRPDWLIVDHYGIDARWHKKLRGQVGKIMVIDDLADRPHDCDMLLDQNLGRKASDYTDLIPDHCMTLVGPKYALLRHEFAALREYSLQRRKNAKLHRVLITMGGVDQHNATGKVLAAINECQLPIDCRITVVMGQNAPWLNEVKQQAKTLRWRTEVLVGIDDMAQRMADSDLAIGAAGATSWERCCMGLPALLLVLAENQKDAALHMANEGLAQTFTLDAGLTAALHRSIAELVQHPEQLALMSEQARRVTEGDGCLTTVATIKSY